MGHDLAAQTADFELRMRSADKPERRVLTVSDFKLPLSSNHGTQKKPKSKRLTGLVIKRSKSVDSGGSESGSNKQETRHRLLPRPFFFFLFF